MDSHALMYGYREDFRYDTVRIQAHNNSNTDYNNALRYIPYVKGKAYSLNMFECYRSLLSGCTRAGSLFPAWWVPLRPLKR